MKKIESYGRIENGKKIYYNEDVHLQHIQEIGFANHFKETIEYGNKRTVDQNAYLFGAICKPILVRLIQEGWLEFSEYKVYKWLENKFSKVEMSNSKTGEVIETVKPLKELSTEEFDEVVMIDIRNYASEYLGIYIKLPHEYYKMSEEDYNSWKRGELSFKEALSTN